MSESVNFRDTIVSVDEDYSEQQESPGTAPATARSESSAHSDSSEGSENENDNDSDSPSEVDQEEQEGTDGAEGSAGESDSGFSNDSGSSEEESHSEGSVGSDLSPQELDDQKGKRGNQDGLSGSEGISSEVSDSEDSDSEASQVGDSESSISEAHSNHSGSEQEREKSVTPRSPPLVKGSGKRSDSERKKNRKDRSSATTTTPQKAATAWGATTDAQGVDQEQETIATGKNEEDRSPPTQQGKEKRHQASSGSDQQLADSRRKRQKEKNSVVIPTKPKIRTPRTWQHEMIRFASLYLFPVLLVVPLSLILSLNVFLLTPLYNSIPLSLHTTPLYVFYAIPPALVYWYLTLHNPVSEVVSARVCISLAALSGDIVAVCGRRVGSVLGRALGPEWGAFGSQAILGLGVVGGGTGFALLCFDHFSPLKPASKPSDKVTNCISIFMRTSAYIFHIWLGQRRWDSFLAGGTSILVKSLEKTILAISLLLTALSFLLRPGGDGPTLPILVQNFLNAHLSRSSPLRKRLVNLSTLLPAQVFPLLLLLRIPLLILALRQQIFLRPSTAKPYVTANGKLRVISSERSVTGQIVIAENLRDGYRFLRCDHSILGGRWIRDIPDITAVDGKRTEMGDSIFATFNLQEVIVLAQRSDARESLVHTLALTTDLEVLLEGGSDDDALKEADRALIIGLGAGIAASTFFKRGFAVDVVEIDPAVHAAAEKHFDLSSSLTSVNLMDGSNFVSQLATLHRENNNDTESSTVPRWNYVVQDCFTGGSVPGEMFTMDFWEDVGELLVEDGVIAMNFAGILGSKASKAVLVTLLSVFPQCRAFGDGFEKDQGPNDMVNMVVICTKTFSPLLTFRPPTPSDVLRSPLRSHVYSTFHPHEIQLDSIISEKDMENTEYLLRRGQGNKLDTWQVGTALSTWKAMQKNVARILTNRLREIRSA